MTCHTHQHRGRGGSDHQKLLLPETYDEHVSGTRGGSDDPNLTLRETCNEHVLSLIHI